MLLRADFTYMLNKNEKKTALVYHASYKHHHLYPEIVFYDPM